MPAALFVAAAALAADVDKPSQAELESIEGIGEKSAATSSAGGLDGERKDARGHDRGRDQEPAAALIGSGFAAAPRRPGGSFTT